MSQRRARGSVVVLAAVFTVAGCAFPTRPIAPPGEQDRNGSNPSIEPCEPSRCVHPDASAMPTDASSEATETPQPMDQRSMGSSAAGAVDPRWLERDSADAATDANGVLIEGGASTEGTNSPGTSPRLGR